MPLTQKRLHSSGARCRRRRGSRRHSSGWLRSGTGTGRCSARATSSSSACSAPGPHHRMRTTALVVTHTAYRLALRCRGVSSSEPFQLQAAEIEKAKWGDFAEFLEQAPYPRDSPRKSPRSSCHLLPPRLIASNVVAQNGLGSTACACPSRRPWRRATGRGATASRPSLSRTAWAEPARATSTTPWRRLRRSSCMRTRVSWMRRSYAASSSSPRASSAAVSSN